MGNGQVKLPQESAFNHITMSALNHQIIVVGGGAAGITVAAQLLKKQSNLDIAIIEPSD
ncbi:MAG: hypothetical protein RLZZ490_1151, partial [Cyanobacteriota bacterium]